jgi:hypothetical protein
VAVGTLGSPTQQQEAVEQAAAVREAQERLSEHRAQPIPAVVVAVADISAHRQKHQGPPIQQVVPAEAEPSSLNSPNSVFNSI